MLNDEENFLGGSLLIAFFGWQDSPHVCEYYTDMPAL